MTTLSKGSLSIIMDGGEFMNPVLQILGNRALPGNGTEGRYRLLVSDSEIQSSFALLTSQLSEKIKSGELCDFTIIKVTNHVVSSVKSDRGTRKIFLINDLEVIKPGSEVGMKIGNPAPATDNMTQNGTATDKKVEPSKSKEEDLNKSKGEDLKSVAIEISRPIVDTHTIFGDYVAEALRTAKRPASEVKLAKCSISQTLLSLQRGTIGERIQEDVQTN